MSNFFTDVIQKDSRLHSTDPVHDIMLLEPKTRELVQAIIADADAHGVKLMVFETFRSQERQQQLFDQGATKLRTVGVHNYGLACDIVKSINGAPSWKGDFSILGELAHHHGMIWGGDWGTPLIAHTFIDAVHVQRCSVGKQGPLFRGEFYPDDNYNPYDDL